MGLFSKINMRYADGLDVFKDGDLVNINIKEKDNEIQFRNLRDLKAPLIRLPLEKLTHVWLETEQEYVEKNKSVIGRAAVGSLLGPLGTIIGGMSGIGTKKRKGDKWMILTIGYEDGEILFAQKKNNMIPNFYRELRKHLPGESREITL